jgi:hypothetical protein
MTRGLLLVGNSVSGSPGPGIPAYPELLTARLRGDWQVTTIIRSGATIEEMEPEIVDALKAGPQAVVLQVGINECAPRPLGPDGRRRLGALRPAWLRGRIIAVIHRWRPQIIRMRALAQFTPLDRFDASLARIVRAVRAAGSRLMILPITEVAAAAEARTPFTNREVARYNGVLRAASGDGVTWMETATLFPGLNASDYCHTPETVHWSGAAHQRVAACLHDWVRSLP